MNTIKKILVLLLTLIILIGVCGCMNTTKNNSNRKESDSKYAELMKNYMEEKYGRSFEIVESLFYEGKSSSGMEKNILVMKDSEGVYCNVQARVGTPYDFFDGYVASYTAAKLESTLENDISQIEKARIYVALENMNFEKIDYSANNVSSLTLVGSFSHLPKDEDYQALYNIYEELGRKGYNKIYFLVGFVKQSEDFDLAVQNYRVYGKSEWEHYNGDFYGYLTVKTGGLSFEDFKACFETSKK